MNSTSNYSYLTTAGKRITSRSFLKAGLSRVDLCHSHFIVVWFITITGVAKVESGKAQTLPNTCCALPSRLQEDLDTLIEQSSYATNHNAIIRDEPILPAKFLEK